jgi:acetoin utilization protein AcuC
MTPRARYGLVDALALPVYDLGADHPFSRDRQKPLADLIDRMGLCDPTERLVPAPATGAELSLAHHPDYIAMVAATSAATVAPATRAAALSFGLGTADNPICPDQHAAAAAVVGGTLECVRRVIAGELRHAFNPTGGLHHAGFLRASGFCIYNDLVVGIRAARAAGLPRVLYVDFDVHHGDGVEFAFDRDPSVMTVSFHQSPDTLFPGTGRVTDLGHGEARGTVANLPFKPYTDDESWWHGVATALPAIVRRFAPALIVSQHGCDPHREDPLAQLQLTTAPMQQAARLVKELAEEVCEGRWVATGGGGYQPYRVIPRAWTMVWAALADRALPARLDAGWLAAWQPMSEAPLTPTFLDPPVAVPSATSRQAADHNQRSLEQLMELLGF